MKKILSYIFLFFWISNELYAVPMYQDMHPRFEKEILSKNLTVECEIEEGDERGFFGITLKEEKIVHSFIVMTGVYYDTCKTLEKNIRKLKAKNSKLILVGTESQTSNKSSEVIWRWRSLRSINDKDCLSYFANDCG